MHRRPFQFDLLDVFVLISGIALGALPFRVALREWDPHRSEPLVWITAFLFGLVVLGPTFAVLRLRRVRWSHLFFGEWAWCMLGAAAIVPAIAPWWNASNRAPLRGPVEFTAADGIMIAVILTANAGFVTSVLVALPSLYMPSGTWTMWRHIAPWQHWVGLALCTLCGPGMSCCWCAG